MKNQDLIICLFLTPLSHLTSFLKTFKEFVADNDPNRHIYWDVAGEDLGIYIDKDVSVVHNKLPCNPMDLRLCDMVNIKIDMVDYPPCQCSVEEISSHVNGCGECNKWQFDMIKPEEPIGYFEGLCEVCKLNPYQLCEGCIIYWQFITEYPQLIEFFKLLCEVCKLNPYQLCEGCNTQYCMWYMEDMEDMEDMDSELESDLASDEDEMDMEDEGEEEEEELQEAKHDKKDKKDTKKALKPKGGDAKKMKEALSFDNVDLVTDDEIINEVLKRVIRRIV